MSEHPEPTREDREAAVRAVFGELPHDGHDRWDCLAYIEGKETPRRFRTQESALRRACKEIVASERRGYQRAVRGAQEACEFALHVTEADAQKARAAATALGHQSWLEAVQAYVGRIRALSDKRQLEASVEGETETADMKIAMAAGISAAEYALCECEKEECEHLSAADKTMDAVHERISTLRHQLAAVTSEYAEVFGEFLKLDRQAYGLLLQLGGMKAAAGALAAAAKEYRAAIASWGEAWFDGSMGKERHDRVASAEGRVDSALRDWAVHERGTPDASAR